MITMPDILLSVRRLLDSGILWAKVSILLVNGLYRTESKAFLSMNHCFLLTFIPDLKENISITFTETEIKIIVTLLCFVCDLKGRGL